MKPNTFFPSILLLFGLTTTTALAERGPSVLDQGLDGTTRNFNVICPSGKRTALSYDFTTKKTCVYPVSGDGEQICKENWEEGEAAKEACK